MIGGSGGGGEWGGVVEGSDSQMVEHVCGYCRGVGAEDEALGLGNRERGAVADGVVGAGRVNGGDGFEVGVVVEWFLFRGGG